MNLADMADHICEKVRKTDSDAVAACKGFIKQRDQMLWDKHLWRDSVMEFQKAVGPAMLGVYPDEVALAAQGVVYLPPVLDRVLAMRMTDRPLPVQNVENYFRGSLDEFAQTGDPVKFSLLSPVAAAFATIPTLLQVNNLDPADNGQVIEVRTLTKGTSAFGARSTTVTLNGALQTVSTYVDEVLGMERPPGVGTIALYRDGVANVTSLSASQTRLPVYQRVRLTPAPTTDITIRVLAKQKYLPLVSDYEEPRLRQAENVLIALVMGDMFVRAGQIGASNQFYTEGMALLEQLGNIEFHQQANRQRLVPDVEPTSLRDWRGWNQFTAKGYW